MRKILLLTGLCLFASTARADEMVRLGETTLASYRAPDRATYLDNLFRLQFVAGRYADSARTIESMHEKVRNRQYEILARALARQREAHVPFAEAFAQEFRAVVRPMDDKSSALVMRLFNVSRTGGLSLLIDRTALEQTLAAARKGRDKLALLRGIRSREAYRAIAPVAAALVAEEDARRYVMTKDIQVGRQTARSSARSRCAPAAQSACRR